MYQGKYASATKPAKKPMKKKKTASAGTKIFYGVYALMIAAVIIGIGIAMNMLSD